MKCFSLNKNESFNENSTKTIEVDALLENKINTICSNWQIRVLEEDGLYDFQEDVSCSKTYQSLNPQQFVVCDQSVVGYYYSSPDLNKLVDFNGSITTQVAIYDNSEYASGGTISRGHIDIVPNPDTDTNPHHNKPTFHSQAEYDDYIKWKD